MPFAFRTLPGDGKLQNPCGWLLSQFSRNRLNHEFLDINVVVSVLTTVMMFIIGTGIEYLPGVPFSSGCARTAAYL